MSVVDELEIELTANAKKANSTIDNLVNKLDTLSGSLSKIDGSRLSGLANGVSKLGMATKTLSGVKATDYNRIAKGFERLAKIDTSKFSRLSSGLNLLSKGMNAIGSVQNLGNITPSINAIKNLARVDMSGFDTSKLQSIANTMSSFATQMSSVGKIEGSVTRIVSSMARLSSSGQYIGNVVTYFPQLGNQVIALVSKLSSAGAIDSSIAKIVEGIARLASAGKKVKDTVANLDKLGDGVVNLLNRLKNAPQINANIANTIQGLGNLASSGSRISTVTGNAEGSTKKLVNALRGLNDRIKGAHKSSKGFVSSIGMFYAKFFLIIRAVKKFGEALGSAQDYIEEFNYFSVALDKIGKDSANQFKKAGYNSAEEYAKSFRSRFSKLQTQLTGYKVDYDTGDATSQMTHNLGLDLTEVMKFNAAIAQITNSAGMLGETSIMTSKALTMLSADWSSLSNQNLSDVMNNMQSALIGQSRAVYKYGIDITSAGLAQTALSHGIKVSIKDLDQQSKMQLRALTMLEQSKVAYGDLARTINQPANQLRMLRAGFQNLARTIGSLFMPIVQKIYPYLNAMVMVLQEFAQWIAKLAGIKLGDISGSVKTPETPDYSDAVDDSGKVADNMDKTAKKAKKASDNLQGFDVINKLQKNDSDTDTGAGNGKPNNTSLDLSKQLANALGNYEKIWDKAFKSNQNKAVQLAEKIKKALLDGWEKGDFSKLGMAFANWINNGLDKIPWTNIKETTKKIAKSIATFLNGAIDGLDWSLVGKTIAEGFNTVTDTLYTFVTTFNWLKFGQGIATGLNSAIANYDWSKLGKTLGSYLRGIIQTAFGFVTNFDFTQFGKKIGDAINGFFEDMGKVDARTGLTGWQELGKTISDSIKGILDTINTALSTVNWSDVGKSIGHFLGSIDWTGIIGKVGSVIANALFSALKIAISAFATDPIGVSKALVVVLSGMFGYNKLKGLTDGFKKSIGTVILEGAKTSAIGKAAKNLASTFKTTLVSAIASSKIGMAIANGVTGIKTAMASLATKISTALSTAFSSAAFVTTLTTAFAAAVAAAIAGAAIADRINEAIDAVNFTGDYELKVPEAMKKASEEANNSLKKTQENAKKIKETIDGINKSVEATNGENVQDLANKYYELSKKTNPTASDIAVMKEYSKQLSDIIPGFSANVDKQTGAFRGNKEQLNGLVSSLDRAAKAEAAYNSSVELYEKQTENNKAIAEKTKELEKNEKELKAIHEVTEQVAETSGKNSERYKAQIRLEGTYANKVNATRAELETLKKSQEDVTTQIEKNNKIMENAKVSSEDYEKASKNLKETMKNLGFSSKETKETISDLQKRVNNGEISWSEYKKVVDGNYNSTEELNSAIQKLSPKTVEVVASVVGKESVGQVTNDISKIPSKKDVSVNINQDNEGMKKLQNFINTIKKGANLPVYVKYGITKEAKVKLANLPKPGGDVAFASALKNSGLSKLTEYLDKLPTYQTGGFPEDGLFFANHNELVGQFSNGKTAVANNDQIVKGIAEGIGPVVYAAMKQALSEMPQQGSGDVYLDTTKVTKEIMGRAEQISRSRGSGWKLA